MFAGHYMFIESSSLRRPGDNAILQSATLTASINCVQFYYNMYGSNIGTLNVYAGGQIVWTLSGNQGTAWKQGQVSVGQTSAYQVLVVRIYSLILFNVKLLESYCSGYESKESFDMLESNSVR